MSMDIDIELRIEALSRLRRAGMPCTDENIAKEIEEPGSVAKATKLSTHIISAADVDPERDRGRYSA
jgi:hypothetical protein